MAVEHADAKDGAVLHKITFNGATTAAPSDFSAKKFAQALVRARKPKMTLAERRRWQADAEARLDDW